jgi:hypothetical protein
MVIHIFLGKRGQIEGFFSRDSYLNQKILFSDQLILSISERESICSSVHGLDLYIRFG